MGSGNEWDASTANISDDEFIKDLPADHRERIKASLDIWVRTHKTPGTGDYQANANRGDHLLGTAHIYYANYAGDLDANLVNRPSGVALDADDVGRLAYDTSDNTFHQWNGTNWIPIATAMTAALVAAIHTWAEIQTFSKQAVFTLGLLSNGDIVLGAGDHLVGSATSNILINTNKFTVAGATGNTLVGGTLDVVGNIDPTSYETTNGGFLDEDNMASDSAVKVASQQSIKAYVDLDSTGSVTHDAEGGFNNCDVDGTKAKVYTKYFTGTSAVGATTNVAHGITGVDKILSVTVSVFNALSSTYTVSEEFFGTIAANQLAVVYDGTNISLTFVGSSLQGQKYRIKIDYIL